MYESYADVRKLHSKQYSRPARIELDVRRKSAHARSLFAVAIPTFAGDAAQLAHALQTATGLSSYEARQRLGNAFPRIVGTHADRAAADHEHAMLAGAGVRAVVIDCDAIERDADRVGVRQFFLATHALVVEPQGGERIAVPYAQMTALIRGFHIEQGTTTTTTRQRKLSPARALLTGGLVMSKKVENRTTTATEDRDAYLIVFANDAPTLALRETALQFASLGDAMQPSRSANFARLLAELRARAPHAAYDERLLTRAGQAQVLGGSLEVDGYTDLAIALVAYAVVVR